MKFLNKGTTNGIKFNVKLISRSFGNIQKTHILNIKLPNLLSSCKDEFEAYYKKNHPSRGLKWYLDFSTLEINYLYLPNKNLSKSTLPQTLILLELEKKEKLSIKQLSEILECSTEIIKKNIRGLIYNSNFNPHCQKDKGVLICVTNETQDFNDEDRFKINETQDFNDEDTFKINLNFTHDKTKFSTIPMVKKKTEEQINNEEILTAQEKKKQ